MLVGIVAVIFGVIGAGVLWSGAQWTPKLALDLEGGTEIVLTAVPQPGTSGTITQQTLDEAVNIIRQRINGTGVSEAEITTQGGRNIVVSLPGKSDEATRDAVKQVPRPWSSAPSSSNSRRRRRRSPPRRRHRPGDHALRDGHVIATVSGNLLGDGQGTRVGHRLGEPPASAASLAPRRVDLQQRHGRAERPPRTATPPPVGYRRRLAVRHRRGLAVAAAVSPSAGAKPSPSGAPAAAKPTDASDTNWLDQAIATTFTGLDCTKKENLHRAGGRRPRPSRWSTCSKNGDAKYVLGPAEVTGKDIKSATAGLETNQQGAVGTAWQVNMEFKSEGAAKFAKVTQRLTKLEQPRNQFAIVLDGLVVSAPRTNEAITGGQAEITGNFDQAEAQGLANQLKFGALPISFKEQTEQNISATLGGEQLQRGLLAGLIGLGLVVLYSLLQYRALAVVTISSLVVAAVITYGMVVLLGWRVGYRLSLPGVIGLIVAIGITADSFIVYFERIRDEVRDGRGLIAAVESAWIRARRTILISDAVNFLAAMVLWLLAVGGVQGFAFTLGLTTLVDVLVVFLFTHPVVGLLARTRFFGGGHRLSGFDAAHLGRSVTYTGRAGVRTQPRRTSRADRSSSAPAEPAPERVSVGADGDDAFVSASTGPVRTGATIAERRAAAERARREGAGSTPGGGGLDAGGEVPADGDSTSRRDS